MVATKESASIRSLRSLELVPPPPKNTSSREEFEKWDPFPAPYAPHASHHGDETREEQECPRGCEESARAPPSVTKQTPPRIPSPEHIGEAAYSPGRKTSRRGSMSSSRTTSTPERSHPLIKVNPSGSVAGKSVEKSRKSTDRRSFSRTMNDDAPVLTRGRIDQHIKTHSPIVKSATKIKALDASSSSASLGEKRTNQTNNESTPSKRSISGGAKTKEQQPQRIFMIGATKIYSRTLITPTIFHNAVTDLWIVTINTSSKLSSSFTNPSDTSNASVKAFSFRTEKEARASAYANSPPVMIPFSTCKECMLCETKFTLFKRPRHCRNCGICICSNYDCCTVWSKKMIPETFNMKKEGTVKVCTSCNKLAKRFQHALLNGRYGTAVELYLTGNINLRVPFVFKEKGGTKESMLPIHCAIEGRSEKLVRWLVDVQHCPLHILSTGNAKSGGSSVGGRLGAGAHMIKSLISEPEKKSKPDFTPTLKTSKGRSVIDIAMKTQDVGILRYLVKEQNVSVYEVEDLDLALMAVEAFVKEFPDVDGTYDPSRFSESCTKQKAADIVEGTDSDKKSRVSDGGKNRDSIESALAAPVAEKKSNRSKKQTSNASPVKARIYSHLIVPPPREKTLLPRDVHGAHHERVGLYGAIGGFAINDSDEEEEEDAELAHTVVLNDFGSDDDNSVSTTVPDICMLCKEKDVDCVATPCGHQVCCLSCSNQCLRCPVCSTECHFIEIYQP